MYIDNTVLKTQKEKNKCSYLGEILKSFRSYNMRLNPTKLSFGVQVGKILGFMMAKREIKVNPNKFQAIIDMTRFTIMKEV